MADTKLCDMLGLTGRKSTASKGQFQYTKNLMKRDYTDIKSEDRTFGIC